LIGVVQATEAVKLLLGKGEPLIGRLLTYDALGMRFREVRLRRDPKCPLCGDAPRIRDLSIHAETSEACAVPGSDGHPAPAPAAAPVTTPRPVGAPWSGVTAGC
jgi:adenylyltransferase/sulfurtransferase